MEKKVATHLQQLLEIRFFVLLIGNVLTLVKKMNRNSTQFFFLNWRSGVNGTNTFKE